ncbi:hypothetical protein ACFC00_43610, partial [Streptomyces adustus]|uniref:hypothetical protein n=1 Tax=Streptomyces adustus TaxID=1609272 RepID=UPI0035E05E7A
VDQNPPNPDIEFKFGHAEKNPVGRSCWWFVAAEAAGDAAEEPIRLRGNPENYTHPAEGRQPAPVKIF